MSRRRAEIKSLLNNNKILSKKLKLSNKYSAHLEEEINYIKDLIEEMVPNSILLEPKKQLTDHVLTDGVYICISNHPTYSQILLKKLELVIKDNPEKLGKFCHLMLKNSTCSAYYISEETLKIIKPNHLKDFAKDVTNKLILKLIEGPIND